MNRRTRLGSYAKSVVDGHILLVQVSKRGRDPGIWTLPGGGLDFGEHPEEGVVRELYEETGLTGRVDRLLAIDSVVMPAERAGESELHWLRFVYEVTTTGAPRVTEVDGTVAEAKWVPLDDVDSLWLMDLVPRAMKLE